MFAGTSRVPPPVNEPVRSHAPGTAERAALRAAIDRLVGSGPVDLPCVIDGVPVATGRVLEIRNPSAHTERIGRVHLGGAEEVARAIRGALAAKASWCARPQDERSAIFLRAADLLAGRHRAEVNAATMIGQGKTPHQAEIDAVCELCDFWRFNVHDAARLLAEQPLVSPPGAWNRMDHRPLDGFVLAITPFNFTSIALNLPTAPALLGNVVVWKPAPTSALACQLLLDVLHEAGLPPGVVQLVHGEGADVAGPALASPDLGGIHFTGSTTVFRSLWRGVADRLDRYRQIPRLVGETGGKGFVLAHPSADDDVVVTALVRGAFEYQGQKCSAASRAYLPADRWPGLRDRLVAEVSALRVGDVRDLTTFVGPVIDGRAFDRIGGWVDRALAEADVIVGGRYDRGTGWFVHPTVAVSADPHHALLREEIFGPVLTVHVYDPASWSDVLGLVDGASPYGLTGAVLARDRDAVAEASAALRFAAGNFYVNDKPTGAVVGQQPFGGSRASGTNDKAGSVLNLLRWVSPRTVKETFDPPRDWRYPYLGEDR